MLAALAVYVIFVSLTVQAGVNDPTQKLLQMLDYIGVDYPPTVSNGIIFDPVEYAEMQEFSSIVVNLLKTKSGLAQR